MGADSSRDYRRSETSVDEHADGRWHNRLELRSYEENGKPALDHRRYTFLHEEGLQPQSDGDQLGGTRSAVCKIERAAAVLLHHSALIAGASATVAAQ